MSQKVWKIRGAKGKFSDEELIEFITNGTLNGDDFVTSNDMEKWIQIKESIYQYYLGGNRHETL